MAALGKLVRFGNGTDYKDVEVSEGGYPVYGSGGLFRRASRFLHDGESVLLGRKGTIDRPIYVSGRFWTVDTMYYTIPGPRIFPKFLYYAATTIPFAQYATNTAVPSMTQADLARHRILLPPLDEQHAIADYLDQETARIDALVAKQEQFIGLLRERRVAEITAGVEGKDSDSSFRRHVTDIRQGWSPNAEPFSADGVTEWGILKVGCSTAGVFRPEENKKLPPEIAPRPKHVVKQGEIVMSRSNTRDLVGSAAVVLGDFPRLMLSDLNYGLTTAATLDPDFAVYALMTRRARAELTTRAKGTSPSMQKLAQRDVLDIPIWVPGIDDQRTIVRRIRAQTARIDTLIAKALEHIALAKERRSALTTAAVTGQFDVHTAWKAG